MIVSSFGTVQALTSASNRGVAGPGGLNVYAGHAATYKQIYRTQPNVRTVVDFLMRNVAELSAHVFRRVSDTDRKRLAGHGLAQVLRRPNPRMTGYRLLEETMGDLGIYFNAFWLKIRGDNAFGLAPLPADQMELDGGLFPRRYYWRQEDGTERDFAPSEIVHFRGYNPCDRGIGLSPLETLRRILAEEAAAGAAREAFWRNSARVEGVVTRPKDAPKWTTDQRQSWREQLQTKFAGPANTGKWAVLEDGMTFTPISATAKDSEYVATRKLTREECAAAYHVPLPLVGILEHATFSNIKEQHKHLYQDCLGPWLKMLSSEFELQLLPEFDDVENVYVEFNIAAKLAGTPEEQTDSLVRATGRPFMKVNEARARVNLPRDEDPESDRIAAQQGGPSDATANPGGVPPAPDAAAAGINVAPVVQATRDRQTARLAKLPISDRPVAFTADLDRWNRELAADLRKVTGADESFLAAQINSETLRQLEIDAVAERVKAIEQRPKVVGIERTYERDATSGLVVKHVERPIEEHV